MEIEEKPINSADPAEEVLPARGPETKLEKVPAAGKSTPSRPDETCSSTVVPRETEATSTTPSPSPGATPETKERAPVVGHRAPTPEGYATPTGSLSATESPTRLRTSPKRKQLSSPDGSEIAAGLVSVVKRHCGSASEPIPCAQLTGQTPSGLPSCVGGEQLEVVGGKESRTPTVEKDGDLEIPPTTPDRVDPSLDPSQGGETDDPVFATPPEGDRSPGTAKGEATRVQEDINGNLPGQPDEFVVAQSQHTSLESPAGTQPQPPAGLDTPGENVSSH